MRRLRFAGVLALSLFGLLLTSAAPAGAAKPILWVRPIAITRTQGAVLPYPPGNVCTSWEVVPNTGNDGLDLCAATINWTYGRITGGASDASAPGVYALAGTGLLSSVYYLKYQTSTVTVVAP